jgi:DNA-binding HxlR family transcriptional regulator
VLLRGSARPRIGRYLLDTGYPVVASTRLGVVTDTATPPADHATHDPADRFVVSAPHRELLDQVLDKWSLAVLDRLCERPTRFAELRRVIPAVTQKSLTTTLRRLERNGVVERVVLSTRPVAVEYRITPLGKTMRAPVDVLLAWAAEHMPAIEAARDRFDDETDGIVDVGDAILRPRALATDPAVAVVPLPGSVEA